jgi:hypothetical protein
MEPDVTDVSSNSQRYAEGLDAAIEVLVIQDILVVPHSERWVGDFVTHKPDAIVSWVRLDLIYCRARPSHDGRLHPERGADRRKCKIAWTAAHSKLTIGDIVVHVALPGMRLTPGIFTRRDILCVGEIGRAGVLRWVQVAHCHCHSMRCAGVSVAGMIVRARWERAGKRIYPGA